MSENILTCSECGHLHFDANSREYLSCPLAGEGCKCPKAPCTPDHPCNVDEWIPCEAHSTAVVIREGASMRTDDELSECFVLDALDLGARMPEAWSDLWAEIQEALSDTSWIQDLDLGDTLSDICTLSAEWLRSVEGHSYLTYWDDGYVIYDITGGPLLG